MLRDALAVLAALTLVSLLGCGGGETPPAGGTSSGAAPAAKPSDAAKSADAAPVKKAAGATAYDKSKGTASVKGKITLEGTAPGRPKIDLAADAKCAAMHTEPMLTEAVVSKDGALQNVIVYVKSGADKYTYDPPSEGVTIDQRTCQYVPHVLALMTGQPLLIKNSDDLAHNIHGMSPTQGFNEGTPTKTKEGAEIKKKFSEPELPMRIQCDVHKWMGAWAGVFDHPFFAVTKEDGTYEIAGLPPGDYEIAVWQESAQGLDSDKLVAPASAKVTVGDKEAKEQNFVFKVKAD